jgi:hypothetical protein
LCCVCVGVVCVGVVSRSKVSSVARSAGCVTLAVGALLLY